MILTKQIANFWKKYFIKRYGFNVPSYWLNNIMTKASFREVMHFLVNAFYVYNLLWLVDSIYSDCGFRYKHRLEHIIFIEYLFCLCRSLYYSRSPFLDLNIHSYNFYIICSCTVQFYFTFVNLTSYSKPDTYNYLFLETVSIDFLN